MRAPSLIAAIIAACLSLTGVCLAGELEERRAIESTAAADFKASRFAALERTHKAYLSLDDKTSGGLSKLAVFYGALNSRGVYDAPSSVSDDRFAAQARRWVRAFPRSTAAALVLARAESNIAWTIRGGGYANTVAPDKWKGFAAHLAIAAGEIERVARTSKDDPQWYASALTLALECQQGWAAFSALATEALQRHPTYPDIHAAILRAHHPQWNGSWEAFDRALDEIVAKVPAGQGAEVYARAYDHLYRLQLTRPFFEVSKASWPRMKQGFEDMVSRYPSDLNLNRYAQIACAAFDRNTLIDVLGRLQGRLLEAAWLSKPMMEACSRAPERARREAEDVAHYQKPAPVPDETIARRAIEEAASAAFVAGQFDRLDAAHDQMLADKSTTASGAWKLQSFYDGLAPMVMLYEPGARVDQPTFVKVRAQTDAWLAAAPTSKAATIARAKLHWLEAVYLRDSLTPTALSDAEKTAKITAELVAAQSALTSSRALVSDDPEWWATSLEVANAAGADDQTFKALAAEAIAAQPTYAKLVYAAMRYPRRPSSIAALGTSLPTVATAAPAERRPEVYALGALRFAEAYQLRDLANTAKLDWPLAKTGLEVILERYPSVWNLNGAANLACLARDQQMAAKLLGRIGENVIEARWSDWRAPKECSDWAFEKVKPAAG